MATIDIKHPHKTTPEDASARTRRMLDVFAEEKKELIKSIEWTSPTSAIAHGRGFEGRFSVTNDAIVVAIDLNMLTRPFKGKVEERLMQRLRSEFP